MGTGRHTLPLGQQNVQMEITLCGWARCFPVAGDFPTDQDVNLSVSFWQSDYDFAKLAIITIYGRLCFHSFHIWNASLLVQVDLLPS